MTAEPVDAHFHFDGHTWTVSFDGAPEVRASGRTLATATSSLSRTRGGRELDVRPHYDFISDELASAIRESIDVRAAAERASERAVQLARRAATALVGTHRVSLRDAARMLGISHQRVHQLLADPPQAGDELLDAARRRRLQRICRTYGVARLDAFGSVARREARPGSDVDLLYELLPGTRLGWEIDDLADALGELFGRPADLVSRANLNPLLRERVLAEAVPVYAS